MKTVVIVRCRCNMAMVRTMSPQGTGQYRHHQSLIFFSHLDVLLTVGSWMCGLAKLVLSEGFLYGALPSLTSHTYHFLDDTGQGLDLVLTICAAAS